MVIRLAIGGRKFASQSRQVERAQVLRDATPAKKPAPTFKMAREPNDNFSARPAPGPQGPDTAELLAWAKQRRRERDAA